MKNFAKYSLSFLTVISSFFYFGLKNVDGIAVAEDVAGEELSYPYTQSFMITAYYSPLPGQLKYVTGSYQGDIRLNGRGTNGADGTPVYPGMVAAPSKYSFGIKLSIPGIGVTAVHDRGGAIVEAVDPNDEDASGPKFDRLDIWMGYGDKGLARALNWGFRTVECTVYGPDSSVEENITLSDYSEDEKTSQPYYYIPEYYESGKTQTNSLFPKDLWYLDQSDDVKKLQEYLAQLGYYNGKIDGYFGDELRMAIYVFQKDKGIIQDITDLGAGHFGLQTRETLEDVIYTRKDELVPKYNLGPSDGDIENVKKLQKLLNKAGYNVSMTGVYDAETSEIVYKFQLDNGVVDNREDSGAGYYGPKTYSKLKEKVEDLMSKGELRIPVVHANQEIEKLVEKRVVLAPMMHSSLSLGDNGAEVKRLQKELQSLNLLRRDPNGMYDEATEHAVFKFQQRYGIVGAKTDDGAGVFGPQTIDKLNGILGSKNYYNKKIAEKRAS